MTTSSALVITALIMVLVTLLLIQLHRMIEHIRLERRHQAIAIRIQIAQLQVMDPPTDPTEYQAHHARIAYLERRLHRTGAPISFGELLGHQQK